MIHMYGICDRLYRYSPTLDKNFQIFTPLPPTDTPFSLDGYTTDIPLNIGYKISQKNPCYVWHNFSIKKSTLDKQFQIPILTDKPGQPMKGFFLKKFPTGKAISNLPPRYTLDIPLKYPHGKKISNTHRPPPPPTGWMVYCLGSLWKVFFLKKSPPINKQFQIPPSRDTALKNIVKDICYTLQGFFPVFWEHDPYTHGIGNFVLLKIGGKKT